jgi:hypothetical protein
MRRGPVPAVLALVLAAAAAPSQAGEAEVLDVGLSPAPDGTWRVSATVRHADEDWDHYANRWEILAPDGTVLAVRELAHPHVAEQPFTRSLQRVVIPEDVDRITIRVHDSVHGYGGAEMTVTVPDRREGP